MAARGGECNLVLCMGCAGEKHYACMRMRSGEPKNGIPSSFPGTAGCFEYISQLLIRIRNLDGNDHVGMGTCPCGGRGMQGPGGRPTNRFAI